MISIASQDNGYPRLEGKTGKISREFQMCPFFLLMIVSEVCSLWKISLNSTLRILYIFVGVFIVYIGWGKEGEERRKRRDGGDRMKVSRFCLQPKEFSSNISLETGTPLTDLYFHFLVQGKLSHSFLSNASSLYVCQKKKCPTVSCFFYLRRKNTKYIAAILPSVPFQENWCRVSWCWPETVNYCDKRHLNPAMKVYFSHTRNLITADSFSLSGSETKVLLSGRSSISEGLSVLCWVSCEWANNLCHSHITE